MKKIGRRVLQCTCGHFVITRKSRYTKHDLAFGATLIVIAVAALIVNSPIVLLIVVLPLLIIPWCVLFIAARAKGHSSSCAMRWAAIVLLGSLGGNGLI